MASVSKEKGKRFEREIANYLTDLFGIGDFVRTHSSGAFTGGSNAHRKDTLTDGQTRVFLGDIIAPDSIRLVVECKNHAEFASGFHGILAGENKKLNGWITEVYNDSNHGATPYLLVFKITGTRNTFWCLPDSHFSSLPYHSHPHAKYIHPDTQEHYTLIASHVFETLKDQFLERVKC